MFKVVVDGRSFRVHFRYSEVEVELFRGCRKTTCVIEEADKTVFRGTAICSRKDQFRKSIGRKHALTRALAGFNREDRSVFWSVYNMRRFCL